MYFSLSSPIALSQSWTGCRGAGCVAVDELNVGIGGLDVGIVGPDVGLDRHVGIIVIGASFWCSKVLQVLETWSKESGMIA